MKLSGFVIAEDFCILNRKLWQHSNAKLTAYSTLGAVASLSFFVGVCSMLLLMMICCLSFACPAIDNCSAYLQSHACLQTPHTCVSLWITLQKTTMCHSSCISFFLLSLLFLSLPLCPSPSHYVVFTFRLVNRMSLSIVIDCNQKRTALAHHTLSAQRHLHNKYTPTNTQVRKAHLLANRPNALPRSQWQQQCSSS